MTGFGGITSGITEGPEVVPPGSMDREGWLSTVRVGRDAGIASTVVMAGTEIAKAAGWASPDTLASMPYTMVAATGLLTMVVRLFVKWFGKYTV